MGGQAAKKYMNLQTEKKLLGPLRRGEPGTGSWSKYGKPMTSSDIRESRMGFYSALNKVSRGEVFWDESDNLIKMKPKQVAKQMTKSQPKTLGTTRRSRFHRNPAVRREMYGDAVLGAGKDLT